MPRKRQLKITKTFAINPKDVEMIKTIADERAVSDSEALRFIIDQYRLFLSSSISSVKEFQEINNII